MKNEDDIGLEILLLSRKVGLIICSLVKYSVALWDTWYEDHQGNPREIIYRLVVNKFYAITYDYIAPYHERRLRLRSNSLLKTRYLTRYTFWNHIVCATDLTEMTCHGDTSKLVKYGRSNCFVFHRMFRGVCRMLHSYRGEMRNLVNIVKLKISIFHETRA
jgi:hypothetical protein